MSWSKQPEKSGIYYIKVHNYEDRFWRFMSDDEYWIHLERLQPNSENSFKWRLNQVSDGWHITPFMNPSIGFCASPKTRPNGAGAYWGNGFAQGRNEKSAIWKVNPFDNWSRISIDFNVLDSRMNQDGRHAGGCVHFYPPEYDKAHNQRWVFCRVDEDNNDSNENHSDRDRKKGRGKTFEDLWFTLTPQKAAERQYDIIIVGTGMGAGVVAGDLFNTNSKLGDKAKSILVIEKGGVPFHSHCLNAARPSGFGEDRGQQNDTFFDLFKTNYKFKSAEQAGEWQAGQMFNLGGRGAAWGLFCPRIHDETLEREFGTRLRQELVEHWYRKAEVLMSLYNPTTTSYHASLMERLNMVSERGCQWQWGRIASEFREEKNFDFAQGAYSPIDKLLEIAMSQGRHKETKQSTEHPNFSILIHSDVRSLELDEDNDSIYSGVWVRDLDGKDTLIKLKKDGVIVLGAGSVGSPTILMRTSQAMAEKLKNNGGLHLTDHDIFATTATYGYLDMSIQAKVGAMKLQTFVKMKSKRIALLNVAIGDSSFLPRTLYPTQQRFMNTEHPKMIAAFIFPKPLVKSNTIELDSNPRDAEKRRNTEAVVNAGRGSPFNSTPDDKNDIEDLLKLTTRIFKTIETELKLCDMCAFTQDGIPSEITDSNPLTFKPLPVGGVAHELGTIPMKGAQDNQRACLTQNLQLRGGTDDRGEDIVTNVYVCDLSIFPFSPEVNPTLTLVALALRLSKYIHNPEFIDTRGGDSFGSTMPRWVMNQTGDPIKVHISNLSGVKVSTKFVNGEARGESPREETILEPGGILRVDRDEKTPETVRVFKLKFGINWDEWKKHYDPADAFTTRPLQYVALPQMVCAIE